jgi:ATP-dependent protease HslVU (ClpYQ) peptidase subunit
MTTIAWDGRTLAADKRTSFGSRHLTTSKVHRINGALVAGAGETAKIIEMVEWLRAGANPHTLPDNQRTDNCVSLLVITPEGEVREYSSGPYPMVVENAQWAIGSGADFARVAMHLGKSAREAVEIACMFDSSSGNGIDTLEFE